MRIRLAILAVAALALPACGGQDGAPTSTTTAADTATTTATDTAPIDVVTFRSFFFRDGALVPVTVGSPPTRQVARAALTELLAGPPGGYQTAIPPGVELEQVTIEDGIATARFTGELGEASRRAQAQIVSTLTQFPTIRAARVEAGGKQVELESGGGRALGRAASAADYGDLTADALIFVRKPARDSTVTSPVAAEGTASVFEATLQVEIWRDGKLVDTRTITASEGAPGRGTWSEVLELPRGDVRLVFFEPSAEDGSHLHETEVLLHVT
jgi:hypothetical protein